MEIAMKRSLGATTLVYPMPAFLIGTYDAEGRPNIMTAAWSGICCSVPPMLAVSLQKPRYSYNAIMERKAFTVSVPTSSMANATDFAGIVAGNKYDKFATLGFTSERGEFVDAPYVKECPVVMELTLHSSIDLGSHTQFIGEIKDVKVSEDCLDEKGKPVLERIDPLVFDGGGRQYHKIGAAVGKAFHGGSVYIKG